MAEAENTQRFNLFDKLKKFNKKKLKPTETRVTYNYASYSATTGGAATALNDEEIKEYYDDEEVLHEKAAALAELMKGKKTVIYTGAGISTSAKIPDYRGPNGIWRSGLKTQALAELHGNVYKEVCPHCGAHYLRPSNVVDGARQRYTGRLCEKNGCMQPLRDSIINFGETLPIQELGKAEKYSKKADVALVLGSSMRVTPACDLPSLCYGRKDEPGALAILNLQKTRFDDICEVRIFGRCDEFMELLMAELDIEVPKFDETQYIQDVQKQFETMILDPKFDKIEKYPGINKVCGPDVHAELIEKLMFNNMKKK